MARAANNVRAWPPQVRPAGELLFSARDGRWLAGGRRLHVVLGLALLGLTAVPAKIVEIGRPLDEDRAGSRPVVAEQAGLYWRWTLEFETTAADVAARNHWPQVFLPAAMGVLAICGGLVRGRGRLLLLCLAGSLPLILSQTVDAGYLLQAVRRGDPLPTMWRYMSPSLTSSMDSLAEAAFFDRVEPMLLLVCLSLAGHRATMRGAGGPVGRAAALGPAMVVFVPVALTAVIQVVASNPEGLLGPENWLRGGDARLADAGRWTFAACRLLLFLLGVLSLVGGVRPDRRVSGAAFVCGWLGLACGVGIAVLAGTEVSLYILDHTVRHDWMLNVGVLLHRLGPPAAGMVLLVGGLGRLVAGFSRPPGEGRP